MAKYYMKRKNNSKMDFNCLYVLITFLIPVFLFILADIYENSELLFFIAISVLIILLLIYILNKSNDTKKKHCKSNGEIKIINKNKYYEEKGEINELRIYEKLNNLDFYKKIIKDIYIPYGDDDTSQIDLVLITNRGIFVIESKNYDGIIYCYNSKNWIYKKNENYKLYIYNPIYQNSSHIKHLSKYLNQNFKNFYSIICFGKNSYLKNVEKFKYSSKIANIIHIERMINDIFNSKKEIYTNEEVDSMYNNLLDCKDKDDCMKKKHIKSINKNKETEEYFKIICSKYQLGRLLYFNKITGGLMHKMYKVGTTKGTYAIKILNPEIMKRQEAYSNYVLSEKISNLAKESNIPVSTALIFNNESILNIEGKYFMIFNFVDGKVLNDEEIEILHCKKMGSILAMIHNLDYKKIELNEEIENDNYSIDWCQLYEIAKQNNKEYLSLLEKNINKYDELYKSCQNILNKNNREISICHRDMDSKNVLWNFNNPVVIDWESAKLSNPYRELIEDALSWSGFLSNNFNEEKFMSFINSYNDKKEIKNVNWNEIILGNLIGRLGWLEYNLKRNLGIKSNDEEEKSLAEKEIYKTIDEIDRYLSICPKLEELLINSINNKDKTNNKKYKILIFDLDDTLIDNRENVKYAYKKMIDKQGKIYYNDNFERWYQIDKEFWKNWQDGLIEIPEKYRNETGKKSEEFLNWVRAQRVLIYFNNEINLERAIYLNNVYMESLTEIVIEVEGAYDTLKYLSDKYFILIATNGPEIATKNKIEKINCLSFVKDILSADMFGYMKPKKEFFDAIQQKYSDYSKEDYLIIGDSLKSDVEFGMNCSIDSCWFDRGTEIITDNYKPTIIIKNLNDLNDIL